MLINLAGFDFYYQGPGLTTGPLPTLLYFALSGEMTTQIPPFNQPVLALQAAPMHIISWDVPFHLKNVDPAEAFEKWIHALQSDQDFITPFIHSSIEKIDYLIKENVIDSEYLGVAGLSRGGFIAAHLAAKDPRIKTLLGFAPLTTGYSLVNPSHSYCETSSLVEKLSLRKIVKQLVGKTLRFYMGNRDTRVGTNFCYHFIEDLVEESFNHGLRSPPVEMIIYPSIGYKGHGTPPEIFQAGAMWMKQILLE